MATISKSHALKLIKAGKAECIGTMKEPAGATEQMYWIINRFDMQRTDHVKYSKVGGFWHLGLLGK